MPSPIKSCDFQNSDFKGQSTIRFSIDAKGLRHLKQGRVTYNSAARN